MKTTEFLKKVPLFEDLSDGEIKKLEEISQGRVYRKNEVIFHTDDTLEAGLSARRDPYPKNSTA